MIHAARERRRAHERRRDMETARKIDMALLTSKAFDTKAGYTYAVLAGVPADLVSAIFSRALGSTRRPRSALPMKHDRRFDYQLGTSLDTRSEHSR